MEWLAAYPPTMITSVYSLVTVQVTSTAFCNFITPVKTNSSQNYLQIQPPES